MGCLKALPAALHVASGEGFLWYTSTLCLSQLSVTAACLSCRRWTLWTWC